MKVNELIAILERCNPESDIIACVQPSWPFECIIDGVIEREVDELTEAKQILASGCRESMISWLSENASSDDTTRAREFDELNSFSTDQITNIFADAIRDEVEHASDSSWTNNGNSDDVILLIGSQLRYADKNLWDKERL